MTNSHDPQEGSRMVGFGFGFSARYGKTERMHIWTAVGGVKNIPCCFFSSLSIELVRSLERSLNCSALFI